MGFEDGIDDGGCGGGWSAVLNVSQVIFLMRLKCNTPQHSSLMTRAPEW